MRSTHYCTRAAELGILTLPTLGLRSSVYSPCLHWGCGARYPHPAYTGAAELGIMLPLCVKVTCHMPHAEPRPALCGLTPCTSLPGSPVCGISQARTLEWAAISPSRGSSQPRDQTCISYAPYVSCVVGGLFTH